MVKNKLKPKVIKLSSQKGKHGYARIKALGKERVLALNNLLARGGSTVAAARLVQQEWGQFQDVAEKTLIQQISRYKHDHIQTISTADVQFEHKDKLYGKLNVLDEMVWLVNQQKQRLSRGMLKEKNSPFPMNVITREVETLQALLKDAQKLQFELGIDEYKGPVMQGGRVMSASVTTPDGTVVKTQVAEAVQIATAILDKQGVPNEPVLLDHGIGE